MTTREQLSLSIYFVLGEESGDALGSRILDAFSELSVDVTANGLAGQKMMQKGMSSLFDISELSIMGISAVLAKLPSLLKRINQTANDIISKNPDVVLLIDSPDFSYRVAKKVRKARPNIKIIKFVAPSVWAWRPGRAKKIAPYIDHILAILPFEPQLMKELGGPEATYVGHPLSTNMPSIKASQKMLPGSLVKLVVLPGSRRGEATALLPVIKETLDLLYARRNIEFEVTIPAVSKLEPMIRDEILSWDVRPKIVTGEAAKTKAFLEADLALCASGTVTLELAIYKVPMVSIYKLDRIMMAIRHLITTWTAALPSLIADYPVIPERTNEYANPRNIARVLERLAVESPERQAQLRGFEIVAEKMQQDEPSHLLATRKILEITGKSIAK